MRSVKNRVLVTCGLVAVLTLTVIALIIQRSKINTSFRASDFLIDSSQPYLSLQFDHVGPKKPLRDGEPSTGIWLALKNNSRLSVVIIASKDFDDGTNDPLWVGDEVVPNEPFIGGDSVGNAIGYQHGQEDLTDIFVWPNRNESEVRGAEDVLRGDSQGAGKNDNLKRPHGYNGGDEPGTQILRIITPGEEVLFSIPANHVGTTWHCEIPFRFALPDKKRTRPPYSYVSFYQEDLKGDQSAESRAKK
jgi:hypothetical protein